MKRVFHIILKIFSWLIKSALTVSFFAIALSIFGAFVLGTGGNGKDLQTNAPNHAISERYNIFINNTLSDTLDGVLSIKKQYWLNDDDLVAPEPNQECFGSAKDPAQLQWLLDEAADLLDGQTTLFTTETKIWEESEILYYLDETILVITWKQVMDNAVYTISEVKIADPSQFRRFTADGQYASGHKYFPSEMAASVNAVVASNGDFYAFRDEGIIVYDGQLMRPEGRDMDSCFIAGNGDLLFAQRKELLKEEAMEEFVKEHDVRFSLAFGPVLIRDGKLIEIPEKYPVGEFKVRYARTALCQRDTLHYYLVSVTGDPPFNKPHNLTTFQSNIAKLGCPQAYNLDGGQSSTIIMNDEVVNYQWERLMSDIIYFATAIPDGD